MKADNNLTLALLPPRTMRKHTFYSFGFFTLLSLADLGFVLSCPVWCWGQLFLHAWSVGVTQGLWSGASRALTSFRMKAFNWDIGIWALKAPSELRNFQNWIALLGEEEPRVSVEQETHRAVGNSSPASQHTGRDCSAPPGASSCSQLIREQLCREFISFPARHKALITAAHLGHSKTLLQTLHLGRCQAHLVLILQKLHHIPAINAPKIHQWQAGASLRPL